MFLRASRFLSLLFKTITLAGLPLAFFPHITAAQAFLPPPGEGNVTTTYQNSFARGHLDLNGQRMPGESGRDPVRGHSFRWEAEYGLNDRLAVSASLPFVTARYGGLSPHRFDHSGQPSTLDDGTYHGSFQDFQFGVRYRITSRPLTITPFVEAIVPSHHYESSAHSAIGKDLRALVIGGAVGAFLDALHPGVFFHTQLSYAVTQEVQGIRPNRTRLDAEVGYFITPRFAARFFENYQVTHNGLDLILLAGPNTLSRVHGRPELPVTREQRLNHDRIQRSNFLNLGGALSFAVSDSLEIFAAGANFVWGESTHPLRALSLGANFHFRTARSRTEPRK